jgi:phosphoserine phosphatase
MARWLVALDMDSTFIQQEVIDLLAAQAGVEAEVASVTERAMQGEIDFSESLALRVSKLAGLTTEDIVAVQNKLRLSPGAEELVNQIHKRGHLVAIFSGGFLNVINPLLTSLEIDFFTANTLEVLDGRLTGRTLGPIIDAQAKADHLQRFAESQGISQENTIAVGDGANDVLMMERAAIGVAYNGKPKAIAAADYAFTNESLVRILDFIPN